MVIINSVSKILCLLILTAIVAAGFLTTAMAQTSTLVSGRILFNKKYFVNAHRNDNITPGYPRAARLSLTWKF